MTQMKIYDLKFRNFGNVFFLSKYEDAYTHVHSDMNSYKVYM